MNRIFKKFLQKLLPPIVGVIYVLGAMQLGGLSDDPLISIAIVGLLVVVPMVMYILYETWQQAKREVEQENKELVRSIKDA